MGLLFSSAFVSASFIVLSSSTRPPSLLGLGLSRRVRVWSFLSHSLRRLADVCLVSDFKRRTLRQRSAHIL